MLPRSGCASPAGVRLSAPADSRRGGSMGRGSRGGSASPCQPPPLAACFLARLQAGLAGKEEEEGLRCEHSLGAGRTPAPPHPRRVHAKRRYLPAPQQASRSRSPWALWEVPQIPPGQRLPPPGPCPGPALSPCPPPFRVPEEGAGGQTALSVSVPVLGEGAQQPPGGMRGRAQGRPGAPQLTPQQAGRAVTLLRPQGPLGAPAAGRGQPGRSSGTHLRGQGLDVLGRGDPSPLGTSGPLSTELRPTGCCCCQTLPQSEGPRADWGLPPKPRTRQVGHGAGPTLTLRCALCPVGSWGRAWPLCGSRSLCLRPGDRASATPALPFPGSWSVGLGFSPGDSKQVGAGRQMGTVPAPRRGRRHSARRGVPAGGREVGRPGTRRPPGSKPPQGQVQPLPTRQLWQPQERGRGGKGGGAGPGFTRQPRRAGRPSTE